MKKLFIIALILVAANMNAQTVNKSTVQAQAQAAADAKKGLKGLDTGEKAWKFSGVTGLNSAFTGLVNWTGGGNQNVNGRLFANLRLLHSKDKIAWDTNLDFEFGLSYINQPTDKFQKTNDKISFTSMLGYEMADKWYLTALASFRTQTMIGHKYEGKDNMNPVLSGFMAPAYTDISIGFDWKPNDIFSVYISPAAGRFTSVIVSDRLNKQYDYLYPIVAGGLEQYLKEMYAVWHYDKEGMKNFSKNTRSEFGFSFKGSVNYSFKDFKVISTLGLYTPYAWDKVQVGIDDYGKPQYRDNNRRFGNFDVDWDVAISYNFLKYLQLTISNTLLYHRGVMIADNATGLSKERVQLKSVLGFGLGYSF